MASLKARLEHSVKPDALRAYLAEFISTFPYVFAAIGSAMASRKMLPDAGTDPSSLVAVAVAVAFSLSVAVYIAVNVSGGYVNPAVTFGMAVGGHISIPMALFYWMSQLLASVMACYLLKSATVSQINSTFLFSLLVGKTLVQLHVPTYEIPQEMTGFGASILEGVMTFALVYAVYASGDPRRGPLGPIGPLAIGFIAGANVLASGPFTGGSMNPATSFGSTIIAGTFKNQAVYWVGPFVGAALACILYDNVVFPAHVPETTDDDRV